MAINTLRLTAPSRFDLLPGEHVLTPRHAAEVELRIPATLSGPKRTEMAKGSSWVTDQRVVFASEALEAGPSTLPPTYNSPSTLESLVIPYSTLLKTAFNLPTFSATHILISFLPDPSGSNLPAPGRGSSLELKMVFPDGAAHAVYKRIEGERTRHEHERNEGEMLPAYPGPSS